MKTYLFFLIVSLLPLASCTSKKNKVEHKITISTLKGPSALSMLYMINNFKGIDKYSIDYAIKNEPNQVRAQLLNEKVDFAILPTTFATLLINKGINYKNAAIILWGNLYILSKDSSINNWGDLKGKRVNLMAKGMTPDVMFKYLLQKNGLNPNSDFIPDYSFPTHIDLANALIAGEVETGIAPEPMVTTILQKNPELKIVLDLNKEWDIAHSYSLPQPQTTLLIKTKFGQEYPELAHEILKMFEKSSTWINQLPDSAAQLAQKYKILPPNCLIKDIIPRCNIRFERSNTIKKEITGYLEVFYNFNPNIIGGKLPGDNYFYEE